MAAPKHNLFALGNNGGRPRHYDNIEELESKVVEYFQYCIDNKENVRITGLALYLGFSSRQSLFDYKSKEEFSYIINRALLVVESHYEDGLNTFKYGGAVFALKNMGWKDQVESNVTQTIVTVNPQVVSTDTPLSGSERDIKE